MVEGVDLGEVLGGEDGGGGGEGFSGSEQGGGAFEVEGLGEVLAGGDGFEREVEQAASALGREDFGDDEDSGGHLEDPHFELEFFD